MPASHCARGCTEAGVRKASKEETAGGVCAGGSVGLWGFKVRLRDLAALGRNCRLEWVAGSVILVGVRAVGPVPACWRIWVLAAEVEAEGAIGRV